MKDEKIDVVGDALHAFAAYQQIKSITTPQGQKPTYNQAENAAFGGSVLVIVVFAGVFGWLLLSAAWTWVGSLFH